MLTLAGLAAEQLAAGTFDYEGALRDMQDALVFALDLLAIGDPIVAWTVRTRFEQTWPGAAQRVERTWSRALDTLRENWAAVLLKERALNRAAFADVMDCALLGGGGGGRA